MIIMIFKKRCPICNKEINSLYEQQLEYNYNQHIESHKRKLPKSKNMIKDIKDKISKSVKPDQLKKEDEPERC